MQVEQRTLVSFCGQLRRVPATEWTLCALHGSAVVGGWFMFFRHEPCPKRRGGSMVAMCGSLLSRSVSHVPTCLVSHSLDRCFDAYDVEWIFKTLSARARASNGRARSQKYCLDCLFSPRIMDRSISSGSARAVSFLRHDSSLRPRDERTLISVSATPAMSVTPKI